VAGSLEGFVSPIETWPLSWKLAVSGATAVLMVIYLSGGRRSVVTVEESPDKSATAERDILALG
jgi:hypothetical protein